MFVKTFVVGCLLAVAGHAASAADVLVFGAASLKDALDAQVATFTSATGYRVVVSYGASNALARQIEAGAPADVFISADLDWMDHIDTKGLVKRGTRVDLLRNTLVLIAPAGSKSTLSIGPGFDLAGALGTRKLAMANPDSVPAGKYAKAALQSLGVWTRVDKQVARAENVRAALVLVSRGEAPFGIVYGTDAHADRGVRIVDTFPAASHPPIVYPAALVANGKSIAAQPFLEYLQSPPAQLVWKRSGFAFGR
jgi:molybdate transport system substrate-binding protein